MNIDFFAGFLFCIGSLLIFKTARYFFFKALKAWRDYQKSIIRVISKDEALLIVFEHLDKNYSFVFQELENAIRTVVDRHSIRSNSVFDIPQLLTHAILSRLLQEHPEHPKNKHEEVN